MKKLLSFFVLLVVLMVGNVSRAMYCPDKKLTSMDTDIYTATANKEVVRIILSDNVDTFKVFIVAEIQRLKINIISDPDYIYKIFYRSLDQTAAETVFDMVVGMGSVAIFEYLLSISDCLAVNHAFFSNFLDTLEDRSRTKDMTPHLYIKYRTIFQLMIEYCLNNRCLEQYLLFKNPEGAVAFDFLPLCMIINMPKDEIIFYTKAFMSLYEEIKPLSFYFKVDGSRLEYVQKKKFATGNPATLQYLRQSRTSNHHIGFGFVSDTMMFEVLNLENDIKIKSESDLIKFSQQIIQDSGLTPLHVAVKYGMRNVARKILEVNFNCVNNFSLVKGKPAVTPICFAIDNLAEGVPGSDEMIVLLLEYGANLDVQLQLQSMQDYFVKKSMPNNVHSYAIVKKVSDKLQALLKEPMRREMQKIVFSCVDSAMNESDAQAMVKEAKRATEIAELSTLMREMVLEPLLARCEIQEQEAIARVEKQSEELHNLNGLYCNYVEGIARNGLYDIESQARLSLEASCDPLQTIHAEELRVRDSHAEEQLKSLKELSDEKQKVELGFQETLARNNILGEEIEGRLGLKTRLNSILVSGGEIHERIDLEVAESSGRRFIDDFKDFVRLRGRSFVPVLSCENVSSQPVVQEEEVSQCLTPRGTGIVVQAVAGDVSDLDSRYKIGFTPSDQKKLKGFSLIDSGEEMVFKALDKRDQDVMSLIPVAYRIDELGELLDYRAMAVRSQIAEMRRNQVPDSEIALPDGDCINHAFTTEFIIKVLQEGSSYLQLPVTEELSARLLVVAYLPKIEYRGSLASVPGLKQSGWATLCFSLSDGNMFHCCVHNKHPKNIQENGKFKYLSTPVSVTGAIRKGVIAFDVSGQESAVEFLALMKKKYLLGLDGDQEAMKIFQERYMNASPGARVAQSKT